MNYCYIRKLSSNYCFLSCCNIMADVFWGLYFLVLLLQHSGIASGNGIDLFWKLGKRKFYKNIAHVVNWAIYSYMVYIFYFIFMSIWQGKRKVSKSLAVFNGWCSLKSAFLFHSRAVWYKKMMGFRSFSCATQTRYIVPFLHFLAF